MSEALAWAAGLFDGEGSICGLVHNDAGSIRVRFYASVNNTNRGALEAFQQIVGCGRINKNKKPNDRSQQLWSWCVGGTTAQSVVAKLRPWLVIKTRQADLLATLTIRFDRKNGCGPARRSRNPFVKVGLAAATLELKRLNHGG